LRERKREREHTREVGGQRERKRQRDSQADSGLSAEPNRGLDPTILRS